MLVDPAAPAPALYSGMIPEDVVTRGDKLPVLTADNLRRTLLSEVRPAAVICGAMWAAAYRDQLDDLEAIWKSSPNRFGLYTLDVMREEELAGWVQVRILPTTLIVRQNRVVQRFAGLTPRRIIQSALVAAEFPRQR